MKKLKTLILSALAVLTLCLGVSGQTDKTTIHLNPCIFPMDQDNFTNAAAWTKVDPITNGNGSIVVGGGQMTFSNADAPACPSVHGACDGRNLRIYRALSGTLSNNSWRARCKFRISDGNGITHTLLAFTNGTADPQGTQGGAWGTCPGGTGSGFTQTFFDGIMASIIAFGTDQLPSSTTSQAYPGSYNSSAVLGAGSQLGWRIFGHGKCGAKISAGLETYYPPLNQIYPAENPLSPQPSLNWSRGILLPALNTDYYLELERLDNGNCRIRVCFDSAMTNDVPGSPQCFQIDPAIANLNTVQNAVSPSGSYLRSATGYIQNLIVWNNCPGIPDFNATASDTLVCPGTGVTLTATPGFINYNWNPGSISSGNNNTIVVNPTTTTTYTVTADYPGYTGCPFVTTVTVHVSGTTPPAPVASSNSPICAGQPLNLYASTISGATYSWSGPNSFSSTAQNPIINPATVNASGVYTVTASIGACSSPPATVTVIVAANPTLCMNGPFSVCPGNCVTISGWCGPVKGVTYSWSPTTGLSNPNTATTQACPTVTTTYTLTATNTSGCTTTGTVTVTVKAAPNLCMSSPVILCAGNCTTISGSCGGFYLGTNFSWTPAVGLSNPNAITTTACPPTSMTYTLNAYNTFTGCSSQGTTSVTVVPTPSITVTPSHSTICAGASVTLTASGGGPYTWSPATGLSATTGSTVVATPTGNITYTVTGGKFCHSQATATIVVHPDPLVCMSGPVTICAGNCTTISGFCKKQYGVFYSWSPTTGLSNPNSATTTACPTVTTTYTLTASNGFGCINTGTVTVTVLPLPAIMVTPISSSICAGNSVSLTASGGGPYTWSPASGLSATTGTSVVASPTVTTVYTVTGGKLCKAQATATVTVNPKPTLCLDSTYVTCLKYCDTLNAACVGSLPGTTYAWTPAIHLSTTSGPSTIACPLSTTSYTVTATNTFGCTASAATTVYTVPTSLTINGPTSVICGNTYTYTATPAIPSPPAVYIWSGTNVTITGSGSSVSITVTGSPAVINCTVSYHDGAELCRATGKLNVTCGPAFKTKNGGQDLTEKKIAIYPNPANTHLTVEIGMEKGERDNICIFNSTGQQVECMELTNDVTSIDINNLSAGIYFYRITDIYGNLLANDKLMIIK